MRDDEIVRSPLRGIRYLLRTTAACYGDAVFVIGRLPFLFLFAIVVDTVASMWDARIFARVGYSDLLFMGLVNFAAVVVQVVATMPLVFVAHWKLLPAFRAQTRDRMSVAQAAVAYLAVALCLYCANNVGFFLCLFGESAAGPGLILSTVVGFYIWFWWVRLAAFFPGVALGLTKDRPNLGREMLRGRWFQVGAILVLAIVPLSLLEQEWVYFGMLRFLDRYGLQTGEKVLQDATWYGLHRLVFVMTWLFVAAVGSRLLQRGIGSGPDFMELTPFDPFNPRARQE